MIEKPLIVIQELGYNINPRVLSWNDLSLGLKLHTRLKDGALEK